MAMAMAMAKAMPLSTSDADLAFQMQLNEAVAASMGIDYSPGTFSPPRSSPGSSAMAEARAAIERDALMAFQMQQQEVETQQRQAADHCLVSKYLNKFSDVAAQEFHDSAMAREIDEMSEEWEDNGDLYERPFTTGQQKYTFKVFFKGFSVSEGGNIVGGALGGAIMDFAGGNQLVQVKKYVACPLGKNAAQYHAMIEVLDAAVKLGARKIILYSDCKTLINQIEGRWRAGTRVLQDLCMRALDLLDRFESFDLNLALHGENWPAENLARLASFSQRPTGGASSSNFVLHCIICMEDVISENVFTLKACAHKFCSSCVKQHVELTVTSGYTFPVSCPLPECAMKFSENECKPLLSVKALAVFLKKVDESRIPEAQRLYCPYPNCSELMDKRGFFDRNPRRSCRACGREFCMECRVPWHKYMMCSEYQRLPAELKDAEDAKLYRLAENQKWRQCKQCRRMIELAEGCYHMTCRCGYEFCYTCGAPYRNKLQTCVCKLWDEHNIIREEDEYESEVEDEEPEYRPQQLYKTRLCRYFEAGHCRSGNRCNFAHGAHELR